MRRLVAAILLALLPSSLSARSAQGPADTDTVWLATKAVAALTKTFRAVGLDATDARDDRLGFRQNCQCHRTHQQQTPAEQSAHPCSRVRHFRRWDSDSDAACWCDWRGRHSGPCTRHGRSRVGGSIRSADRIRPGVAVRRQRSPPSYAKLEVDGQVLFHGPPGLRGEAKVAAEVSSDEFLRRVATLVVASLRRKPPVSEYRSALVQIVVTGTAVTAGECRVDGLISTELLETLSKLSWPEGSPQYMFKLFFVG